MVEGNIIWHNILANFQPFAEKKIDARHMHCSRSDCRNVNGQHLVPKKMNFATLEKHTSGNMCAMKWLCLGLLEQYRDGKHVVIYKKYP